MSSRPASSEWQLSAGAFERFLDALHPERDRAAERYEVLRGKLIRFFEWRRAPFPEEHADDTLTRVIRKLDAGESIEDAATYCYGVARMVLLETHKKRLRELEALSAPPLADVPIDERDVERRVQCLTQCLETFSQEHRVLILDYHRHDSGGRIASRKRLAASLGIPLNALRIRVHRLTERLSSCVQRCVGDHGRI
jgi:DNA-directed RNA polymerase specialized sigma24 family protein